MILDAAVPPTPDGVDGISWMAAIAAIRGACGWHVAPNLTETAKVDGWGGGSLLLPTLHLTGITSITNQGTALTVEDLSWSELGIVHGATWSSKLGSIEVVFTHGFEQFPAELLAVARAMAREGVGTGAKSMTSGPHSMTLSDSAQELRDSIIDRYRIGARP
jgi:hypothetical protein